MYIPIHPIVITLEKITKKQTWQSHSHTLQVLPILHKAIQAPVSYKRQTQIQIPEIVTIYVKNDQRMEQIRIHIEQ